MVKGQGMNSGKPFYPLEKIQLEIELKNKIVRLMDEVARPLPTTFRTGYSIQVPVALAELARTLRIKHNIRVNEKLEASFHKIVIKLARQVNQTLQKPNENQQQGVDSQSRSGD